MADEDADVNAGYDPDEPQKASDGTTYIDFAGIAARHHAELRDLARVAAEQWVIAAAELERIEREARAAGGASA